MLCRLQGVAGRGVSRVNSVGAVFGLRAGCAARAARWPRSASLTVEPGEPNKEL